MGDDGIRLSHGLHSIEVQLQMHNHGGERHCWLEAPFSGLGSILRLLLGGALPAVSDPRASRSRL